MSRLKVAISQDFFNAFASIPRAQQRKVNNFVSKFRNNPRAPGINYEKINNAAHDNYRSVRIDRDYRGIVYKPDRGNTYLLLWVASHDEAYRWAERNKCGVNATTGTLQVYEVLHDAEPAAAAPPEPEKKRPEPLLGVRDRELLRLGVPDRELLRLGVPEDRIEKVQALTSMSALEALKPKLPVEAFEAVWFLANGVGLAEVMDEYALSHGAPFDQDDVEAALESPQTRRRFAVVESELELQQMLEAPLEQWRVFLHPTQRRLVERDWNGPVRVLGGAGTGKTVVAMHRARWLAENVLEPGERLLFTTFTRNLAMDIEAALRTICTPGQMNSIEVVNIDAWVARFLKRNGEPGRIVYPGQTIYDDCWKAALGARSGSVDLSEGFYLEEFHQTVLPQRVQSRADYFRASRRGRGTPLSRRQRAAIWPVFEEMRFQLHQKGLLTASDAMFATMDMLDQGRLERPYRAAVVDETQDLGPEALRMLRALVPQGMNDLMLVGDGHQRIYGRRSSFRQCGINIVGRAHRLRINYRTTEEIRRWAVAVFENIRVDDLDGKEDSLQGYRSLMNGNRPLLHGSTDSDEEADWVVDQIQQLLKKGHASQEICVAARTARHYGGVKNRLEQAGIATRQLSRTEADNSRLEGVRLATMHRVKGLEFRIMFVVDASKGVIPFSLPLQNASDSVERKRAEEQERALLHVSATRAVEQLYVSWSGEPSPFLTEAGPAGA